MRKIFFIGNPAAGRNALKKIKEASAIIKSIGHDVQVLLTEKRGDAESFAREISRMQDAGYKIQDKENTMHRASCIMHPDVSDILIIAAGGDGTFNEALNGIAGSDVPMAILPLGTTNVLAKELGIPEDVNKAMDIALSGKVKDVCLGRITLSQNSNPITRCFLLMAGIGYDGETVYGMRDGIKRYSGKGAYVWSALKTLLHWNPGKLIFKIDGRLFEGYSAIICNASKYAGNFKIAPEADISKPLLFAVIMHGKRRLDIIRYIMGMFAGKHAGFDDITYKQAEKIEIEGNAFIQIDGDYLGIAPATIQVMPKALKLVY